MLTQGGTVWAAGINTFGQLGIDSRRYGMMTNFVEVVPGGAKAVAAGASHSLLLTQDGSVWSTGRNVFGQLGDDGLHTGTQSFVQVIPNDATAVAAGARHSLVVMRDGSVWTTGFNLYGQLGDGSTIHRSRFVQVVSGGADAVAAGSEHSMVLMQDGSVWTTGLNSRGQLGDGSESYYFKSSFVQVVSNGTKAIAAGGYHSIVLKQDNSVWTTGENSYGQLGYGTTTSRSNFVQVVASGAQAIAAGHDHSMVLKQDGSVWATGRNNFGQLGDGTRTSSETFVKVISSGVQTVAAGDWDSMVLTHDCSLWATGSNVYGQVGDGSTIAKNKFVRVLTSRDGAYGTLRVPIICSDKRRISSFSYVVYSRKCVFMPSLIPDAHHFSYLCSNFPPTFLPIIVFACMHDRVVV